MVRTRRRKYERDGGEGVGAGPEGGEHAGAGHATERTALRPLNPGEVEQREHEGKRRRRRRPVEEPGSENRGAEVVAHADGAQGRERGAPGPPNLGELEQSEHERTKRKRRPPHGAGAGNQGAGVPSSPSGGRRRKLHSAAPSDETAPVPTADFAAAPSGPSVAAVATAGAASSAAPRVSSARVGRNSLGSSDDGDAGKIVVTYSRKAQRESKPTAASGLRAYRRKSSVNRRSSAGSAGEPGGEDPSSSSEAAARHTPSSETKRMERFLQKQRSLWAEIDDYRLEED